MVRGRLRRVAGWGWRIGSGFIQSNGEVATARTRRRQLLGVEGGYRAEGRAIYREGVCCAGEYGVERAERSVLCRWGRFGSFRLQLAARHVTWEPSILNFFDPTVFPHSHFHSSFPRSPTTTSNHVDCYLLGNCQVRFLAFFHSPPARMMQYQLSVFLPHPNRP